MLARLRRFLVTRGRTKCCSRSWFAGRAGSARTDAAGHECRSPPARALSWIRANTLSTGGVRAQSLHANAYAEVTGYLVPTLIGYGEHELAEELSQWLVNIQRSDGSFTDPDCGMKYVFDSGQVLRGLVARSGVSTSIAESARRAVRYIRSCMVDDGRRGFPAAYEGTSCPEPVLLYALPPLVAASQLLGDRSCVCAVGRCVEHYMQHPQFLRTDDLTHFLAYQLDALIDLGHPDLADRTLEELGALQKSDGSVRGVGGSEWVCTPGLAQLAICWYKIGDWQAGDRALGWLDAHQEPSGGFRGSYGPSAAYMADVEVPWAVKFYLDANLLRQDSFFLRHAAGFPQTVAKEDGRFLAVSRRVRPSDRVAEIGCGKGRFLDALRCTISDVECVGVDPSAALLSELSPGIRGIVGRLESIPLPDESFDVVFSVEAIEHASNPERAIAEMVRICRPGGWIVIVDKQRAHWGRLDCPPWEWWPDVEELQCLLRARCDNVSAASVAYEDRPASDGLMVAWAGQKRSRLSAHQWNAVLISGESEQQVVDAVRFGRFAPWGSCILSATKPGQKVLEIGSGTGEISLQMAQSGRLVTCLDSSQESLEFTKRCAKTLGVNICTCCSDAAAGLPFAVDEFDCVWSSGLLEHFAGEERKRMLREWGRLCRGKLISLVPNASCLIYQIGKALHERRGTWPYGLETPLISLRDDYESAGLRVISEFSVGGDHALNFLSSDMQSLRENVARVFHLIPERELSGWNQGYLLVTIGTKTV